MWCRSGRGCVVPRAADGGAHLVVDRHDRPHGLIAGKPSDRQAVAATASLFRGPVGELSQRLSELGTLHDFLTGTAFGALDLLFATIYILIMLMYSPLLTAVALGVHYMC